MSFFNWGFLICNKQPSTLILLDLLAKGLHCVLMTERVSHRIIVSTPMQG